VDEAETSYDEPAGERLQAAVADELMAPPQLLARALDCGCVLVER
jgi:hypothetical protein